MGNRLIRRDHKDAAEKRIIRIERRRSELWHLGRTENEERVPLEEPIFWGYRRYLVLRKDVASRLDADHYLELLKLVQNPQDSRRKDFKQWDTKLRRWMEWPHRPAKISPRVYDQLPRHFKSCFYKCWSNRVFGYRIADPWMFESRRHRLYITHRRIPNGEVKQELAYWQAIWEQERLRGIHRKVKSRKARWKSWTTVLPEQKQFARLADAEIRCALELHAAGQLHTERGKEVIRDAKA